MECDTPRAAQIRRLQDDSAKLRQRIADHQRQVEELTAFKTTAISRLAAQHAEITTFEWTGNCLTDPRALGRRAMLALMRHAVHMGPARSYPHERDACGTPGMGSA